MYDDDGIGEAGKSNRAVEYVECWTGDMGNDGENNRIDYRAMRMAEVGMRKRQKQPRRRHGRNEGPCEINFGKERRDDGKWCDEEHDGIDELR